MFSNISFPFFGIEVNPPRSFEIFGIDIYFYGVIITIGMLLAGLYALKRSKEFGITHDNILDGVLWIVPLAIVCARLYYCIFSWEMYADNPLKILNIRDGGLAIYGGVIGAIVGIIIFCKIKKISIGAVLDLTMLGFLIGQSIGRWGNFINREAFGAETDIFIKMGLLDTTTQTYTYYHPTFLYESLWNAIGFVILHFLSKKRQYDGQIALCYAIWYGLGRMWIEGLRTDSLYLGSFRISQILAGASFIIALIVMIILAKKPHKKENLFVNRKEG